MKILVAITDESQLRALERELSAHGHSVVGFSDNVKILGELNRDQSVDMLIVDWKSRPGDIIGLCKRLRTLTARPFFPVILLSDDGTKEDEVVSLDAGADFYVAKPIYFPELLAKIHVAERIINAEASLQSQLSMLAETQMALAEANKRMRHDLEVAAEIQSSLIPSVAPPISGVECAWTYRACTSVAGDIFNVVRLDETHLGIYVLDVSGHGVGAALLSVSISRIMNPVPQQGGILRRTKNTAPFYDIVTPAEVATTLNDRFPVMSESGQYFTMIYGVLEVPTGRFVYTRCGHTKAILSNAGGYSVCDDEGGMPVGVFRQAEFPENSIILHDSQRLVLHTDGITDIQNVAKHRFGDVRFLDCLEKNHEQTLKDSLDATIQEVDQFRDGSPQNDDITVLGLEYSA